MPSLQARLGLGLLLSLVATFLVLWGLVSYAIRGLTEDYMSSRLAHDGETLLAALNFDKDGRPRLAAARIDPVYRRPFSGRYFQIRAGEAVLRSRSLWDQALTLPALAPGETRRLRLGGPQAQPLLVWVAGFRKQDRPLTLAVAEDLSGVEADIRRFQRLFALTAAALLLPLLVLQVLIVRTGLKPLDRVRREIRALERGEVRTLTPEVPREVAPLVHEVNRLLQIMGRRLQRSRNALGDLAHALKAPLTVLRQLRRDEALEAQPALREALVAQTDTMQRVLERVLRRARLAGEGPAGAHFSLEADLPALVDTLRRMHPQREISFETEAPPAGTLALDREDLLELLGNLLDNACKWARRRVRLAIRANDTVHIVVEDDGPGVEPPALAGITRRGARLDESAEGHGLGLAIVKDVIDDYGGSIDFGRSESLGGLRVNVRLPLARGEWGENQ